MGRYAALEAVLGAEAVRRVRTSRVLLVGAGGIGCELVKDLVLAGFGEIHMVDLDTIDLSNLNRQFLFSRQHVNKSKAEVAAEVAGRFNPDVHLVPYVANIITSPEFTPKFYKSFTLVFNALDNAEARRHVNRMCVRTNVPLIDCGSAGFHGQTQVILPGKSECYDCRSHPAPTTFPVCTIRSTPSKPVHCVVWAKSYLFGQLFGETDDAVSEGSKGSEEQGDPAELAQLRRESNELADLRESRHTPEFVSKIVDKVFVRDVERLLLAPEAFTRIGRAPPVALHLDAGKCTTVDVAQLDEHKQWTAEEAYAVLQAAAQTLAAREGPVAFDKDDSAAMDFVAAAAMLRARVFEIPQKTRFAIKEIAGNIIAAVASTNAIVSGFGALEALKIVAGFPARDVDIYKDARTCVIGDATHLPSASCVVCGAARTTLHAPPATPLRAVLEDVLRAQLGYADVSLVTDRLLYDPDFDDQLARSVQELGLVDRYVTVVDEDERRADLELYIAEGDTLCVDSTHVPLRPTVKRARESPEPAAKRADVEVVGETIVLE